VAGFHVYVLAPEAVKADDEPVQMELFDALTVITGAGFTTTTTES
jgi:hypothetical protein